jgi:uncharacterized membrane protein YeaQ/YmgE (transglycosylase-associated protein family)
MKKLMIFVGMTIGGWAGSALTSRFGVMTSFIAGSVGSIVGILVAWRFVRDLA